MIHAVRDEPVTPVFRGGRGCSTGSGLEAGGRSGYAGGMEIALLTVRQLLSRGRVLILLGVVALPPFVAALYVASSSTIAPDRFLSRLCEGPVLALVLPLLALIIGGAALGNEVEDGTLQYLVMKPVSRLHIVLAKLAPAVVIVALLAGLSVLASALIVGRDGHTLRIGLAFLVGSTAGALAYTTLFLLLGLVTTRSFVIGLAYVFLWEGALSGLFAGLRALSVRQYARAIAAALANVPSSILDVKLTTTPALIGVVVVTVLGCLVATLRLRKMDVE